MIFEFLNFFVKDNWVYSKGNLIDDDEFVVYAVLGSSGLMPMVFEWFSLLNTFKGFRQKYTNGPKIVMANRLKIVLLILSFTGMFATSFYPDKMFSILWTGPLIILAIVLNEIGIWTPFTPIKYGNWSPFLLIKNLVIMKVFIPFLQRKKRQL
ncbi:MAG: hypothetical protein WKG06_31055 [Segetibacter sp.]